MNNWGRDREIEKPKRREVFVICFNGLPITAYRKRPDAESKRDELLQNPVSRALGITSSHLKIMDIEVF